MGGGATRIGRLLEFDDTSAGWWRASGLPKIPKEFCAQTSVVAQNFCGILVWLLGGVVCVFGSLAHL